MDAMPSWGLQTKDESEAVRLLDSVNDSGLVCGERGNGLCKIFFIVQSPDPKHDASGSSMPHIEQSRSMIVMSFS